MPRGKYVNHKGRGRSFTSAEELAREQREMKNKKKLKDEAGEDDSDEEEEGEGGGGGGSTNANDVDKTKKKDQDESSSSEEESEEEDENRKAKGVEGLLVGQIENPNRRVVKPQKLKNLDSGDGSGSSASASAKEHNEPKPELSRREREAIEKQKAKERYQKLHAEGKTDEAQKDLARLAIIRKQREEAAAKRLAEQTEKLALKQTKQAETSKALGKKW